METVKLTPSLTAFNCSRITWCCPDRLFMNDIQRLLSKNDVKVIHCGEHSYMFNMHPYAFPIAIPFSFEETNMLMQLMPDESEGFYLRAALREFVNNFIVINCKDERVSPEDIPNA